VGAALEVGRGGLCRVVEQSRGELTLDLQRVREGEERSMSGLKEQLKEANYCSLEARLLRPRETLVVVKLRLKAFTALVFIQIFHPPVSLAWPWTSAVRNLGIEGKHKKSLARGIAALHVLVDIELVKREDGKAITAECREQSCLGGWGVESCERHSLQTMAARRDQRHALNSRMLVMASQARVTPRAAAPTRAGH
jgi:hypothetical protein